MPHFIFIQQISALNILNMPYNLHFFLQNAFYFIILPCLVSVLLTFYIQDVLNLKKKFRHQKFNCQRMVHKIWKMTKDNYIYANSNTFGSQEIHYLSCPHLFPAYVFQSHDRYVMNNESCGGWAYLSTWGSVVWNFSQVSVPYPRKPHLCRAINSDTLRKVIE